MVGPTGWCSDHGELLVLGGPHRMVSLTWWSPTWFDSMHSMSDQAPHGQYVHLFVRFDHSLIGFDLSRQNPNPPLWGALGSRPLLIDPATLVTKWSHFRRKVDTSWHLSLISAKKKSLQHLLPPLQHTKCWKWFAAYSIYCNNSFSVRVVSCFRFSIHVGLVPNGVFGPESLSSVGYTKLWMVLGFLYSTIYNLS